MAYRLKYSDYSTTAEGPPDPAAWVGPPGPQGVPGPAGPQGIPGPDSGGLYYLPLAGGSLNTGANLAVPGKLWQGNAANPPTWAYPNTNAGGVGWFELVSEAQFYSKTGGGGVAAVARASDYTIGSPKQAYAFLGYGLSDVVNGVAEGMYLEANTTVVGATAMCIEMDAINTAGTAPTINPYQVINTGATVGIAIAAGGGPGRPGPFYPSSAALVIDHNNSNFMRGIVFGATGINGANGTSGSGIAIQMAMGHELQWTFNATGARSSFIRCDATASSLGIVFGSNVFYLVDTAEAVHFSVSATGVINNYGGIVFNTPASGMLDLSKHLDLGTGGTYGINYYSGALNLNVGSGGSIGLNVGGTQIGVFSSNGMNYIPIGATGAAAGSFTTLVGNTVNTGGAGGPTWTSGSTAPAATAPVGSIYSRVGGAVGATLYVSRGAGTWAAIAGV